MDVLPRDDTQVADMKPQSRQAFGIFFFQSCSSHSHRHSHTQIHLSQSHRHSHSHPTPQLTLTLTPTHTHTGARKLYYRFGIHDAELQEISWKTSELQYDVGLMPCVTLNNNGVVVEVHRCEHTPKLYCRLGLLSVTNTPPPLPHTHTHTQQTRRETVQTQHTALSFCTHANKYHNCTLSQGHNTTRHH